MRIIDQPQTLYDTPIAHRDIRYRLWLSDFGFAGERLTGVNPIKSLSLARQARRWYLAGLSPYDAVNRWQNGLVRKNLSAFKEAQR